MSVLQHLDGEYRLGLVSNFTDELPVIRVLDREGLSETFRTVQVSARIGYRKPHPRIFQEAVDGLGLDPGAILFVGDHPVHDVAGARACGMQTMRVARADVGPLADFLGEEVPSGEEADWVIGDLREIEQRIG